MNVEVLISEILVRIPLWDQKDKNHHNRFVLDRLWNEVAKELNTKPKIVRQKWKALRDKFRSTLASIPKAKSGDVQFTDYTGEWKYFKTLLFLKDQFTPKNSSENYIEKNAHETLDDDSSIGNLSREDSDDDLDVQNYLEKQEEQTVGSPHGISSTQPSSSFGKGAKRSNNESIGNAFHQVEKEKLQHRQEKRARREDDEDMNFFKSLLPHVRKFSAHDKMGYRMGVLKLTQDYLKSIDGTKCMKRDV